MALRSILHRTRTRTIQLSLQEMREQLGVRRADVARRLSRSPQAILQFEQGLDPKVSTLRDYVRALADEIGSIEGAVRITAVFDNDEHEIAFTTDSDGERSPTVPAPTTPAPVTGNAWKIGSASWFTPEQARAMLDGGYIAMSEDEIDVSDDPDDRTLDRRLRDADREDERKSTDRGIQTFVRYWRTFLTAVRPGDVVVLPLHRGNIAIGVVSGSHEYEVAEPDPKLRHRRAVDWINPQVPRSRLPDDLQRKVGARGTIGRIRADEAASRLSAVARQ